MSLHDILTIIQLGVTPILGAIAWFLKGLHTSVTGIETQLRALNGRMVKMEEWRNLHEVVDLQREERAVTERREIREDLHRAQDSVQRQISDLQHRRQANEQT